MRFSIFTLCALVSSVTAFPGMRSGIVKDAQTKRSVSPEQESDLETRTTTTKISYKPYLGPRSGDVRSPCPGLNSAANHDICPRSGKGYTIPILIACLQEAYNIGADFTTAIGLAGIGSNPNPTTLGFDLDQLARHEIVIEHDGSLSRRDAYFGDNYSFNQDIFNTVLAYFQGGVATIPTAARARFNRIVTERTRDPSFFYGPLQFVLSYGETALYLSTMGNPISGDAPVKYVKSLFEEEKLPYHLGWKPSAVQTTLTTLGQMVIQLNAALAEPVPEGLILGESALKLAFSGKNPVTGKSV